MSYSMPELLTHDEWPADPIHAFLQLAPDEKRAFLRTHDHVYDRLGHLVGHKKAEVPNSDEQIAVWMASLAQVGMDKACCTPKAPCRAARRAARR